VSDAPQNAPVFAALWHRLVRDERHGPLPGLLLALTALTGVVDAMSILHLARVFVANMTGNVVFIAFGLAGAAGFSTLASFVALAAFLVGAFFGGRLAPLPIAHRGRALRTAAGVQLAGLVCCALLAGVAPGIGTGLRYSLTVLLAFGMGVQNAVVRRIAVPDLTTTVLTMTMTGLASDHHGAVTRDQIQLRVLSVVVMFAGGLLGAVLTLHCRLWVPLTVAAALSAAVTIAARAVSRDAATWSASK
jgi:uncharacterized membrane protein YoaK (UPF0700 family)